MASKSHDTIHEVGTLKDATFWKGSHNGRAFSHHTALIERRLRLAGMLVCAGLVIQLLTLSRTHPLAFVGYILIASPLVLAGLLLYLC